MKKLTLFWLRKVFDVENREILNVFSPSATFKKIQIYRQLKGDRYHLKCVLSSYMSISLTFV